MSANLMSLARSGGKFLKLFGDRKMVKPLPYLRRVAYLEGHGTEWIDTRVSAFEWPYIRVVATVLGGYMHDYKDGLCGNSNGGSRWQGISFSSTSVLFRGYDNVVSIPVSYVGTKLEYVFDGPSKIGRVGDLSVNLLSGNPAGIYYGIFSYFGRVSPIKARIYSAEISSSSVLFKSYPVLDISGRPAMYDEVSGNLFYNQGTGEFTWGELDSQTT